MKRYLLVMVIALLVNSASAAMRTDFVKIRGKVYSFNKEYAYLKTRSGRKTLAPVGKFTKKQLRSRKEVTVYLSRIELAQLLTKVRLYGIHK